jgi:ectoine hydroxylase-related dioxygenase (phytanoyl-CoA dioxygenase family)
MQLTEQQKQFFETFGYIVLPGLLADDIQWITEEFEEVFRGRGVVHDGTKRSTVVPFIDQRERLSTLLDHPKVVGLISSLLGEDFNYVGGDGNYYTGDTQWHSDGWHDVGKFLKVALYLDPVTRDTGCLRVIPGTHRRDTLHGWDARQARKSLELWGIEQRDVPAVPLESNPGDVVAFNHNLMHAAFGGSSRRRMFTLNCCARCHTEAEIEDLEKYVASHARFWLEKMHSDIMRSTASPQRMIHLQQVMEHEAHLPALSAKARAEMAEPSRG